MISLNDRHRLHQFLMIELAIRYLEKDLPIIQTTKCVAVFLPFIERLLKTLRQQYKEEKQYFAHKQIQLIQWKRVDHYFSEVSVTTLGEDAVFTYANQAVKMHVEEIILNTYNATQSKQS